MYKIKGNYAEATLTIDNLGQETISQIYTFLNHPAFAGMNIVIMPDAHKGEGSCIGFTATSNNYVIPNIVGVDIGCGVLAYRLGKLDIDYAAFDTHVRENIPCGFNKRNKPATKELAAIYTEVASLTEQNPNDVWHSQGTLGGGNHFIEIDKDDDGVMWLVIHTGSRNFGLKIANFYQKRAKEELNETGDAYKGLEFLFKGTQYGDEYIHAMHVAQRYASENRRLIGHDLLRFFGLADTRDIESIHNYIDDAGTIRKGAISAFSGQKLLIPLNMRDGTIVGTGKGNADWNYSAPHGAGRLLARKDAKRKLSLEDFIYDMSGIFTTSANRSTLDEAPRAYKDKDWIVDSIGESVDIDFIMKPVYSFKSSELMEN